MDVPLLPTSPAKLYAFQLKLRPLQEGTLMPFSGELVHLNDGIIIGDYNLKPHIVKFTTPWQ